MSTYQRCLREALTITDRDEFISELALSTIWEDEGTEIPQERIDWLAQLWDAAHRSCKDIAAAAGASQRKLAERFAIPYKTVEDWCRGTRTPPAYTLMMMQECLGLFRR